MTVLIRSRFLSITPVFPCLHHYTSQQCSTTNVSQDTCACVPALLTLPPRTVATPTFSFAWIPLGALVAWEAEVTQQLPASTSYHCHCQGALRRHRVPTPLQILDLPLEVPLTLPPPMEVVDTATTSTQNQRRHISRLECHTTHHHS